VLVGSERSVPADVLIVGVVRGVRLEAPLAEVFWHGEWVLGADLFRRGLWGDSSPEERPAARFADLGLERVRVGSGRVGVSPVRSLKGMNPIQRSSSPFPRCYAEGPWRRGDRASEFDFGPHWLQTSGKSRP
jgi:hypothetical protein